MRFIDFHRILYTVKLYLIKPFIGGSCKIVNNRVYEVTGFSICYSAIYLSTKPVNSFPIYYGRGRLNDSIFEDEKAKIAERAARIFTSKEDAQKALDDEVKILSYNAIKYVDAMLDKIKKDRERIDKKEQGFKELKKKYYEASLKRFAK